MFVFKVLFTSFKALCSIGSSPMGHFSNGKHILTCLLQTNTIAYCAGVQLKKRTFCDIVMLKQFFLNFIFTV
jgi:hypothetical protein